MPLSLSLVQYFFYLTKSEAIALVWMRLQIILYPDTTIVQYLVNIQNPI
ncbi:hypothetical protein [Nostoc sp.]